MTWIITCAGANGLKDSTTECVRAATKTKETRDIIHVMIAVLMESILTTTVQNNF